MEKRMRARERETESRDLSKSAGIEIVLWWNLYSRMK